MKHLSSFIVLLIASVCVFSQSEKQTTAGFIGSIGAGTVVPVGPLNNGWKAGLLGEVNVGYIFSTSFVSRLAIAYGIFGIDGGDPFSGGKFGITTLHIDLLYGSFRRDKEFIPYIIAGGGANFKHRFDLYLNDEFDTPGYSETEIGVMVGFGAAFRFNKKYSLFTEMKYSHGFGDEPVSSFIPISFGVMMTP